jgi:hypothetical protein
MRPQVWPEAQAEVKNQADYELKIIETMVGGDGLEPPTSSV